MPRSLPTKPFQQSCFPQACQKIPLDLGKALAGNGIPGDEHQVHRLRELVLMQTETLPQEPSRPAAGHRSAHPTGGNNPKPRSRTGSKRPPIGDKTTERQPLTFLPYSRKVSSLLDVRSAAEAETAWREGGHAPALVAYTGVNLLRPTRRRLRKMALPLLLELRLKNPCCRLRRIFDG